MNDRIGGIEAMMKDAAENGSGRKVAIWGNNPAGEMLRLLLMMNYRIAVSVCVDDTEHSYSDMPCFSPDVLDGKSAEYYVIAAVGFRASVKERLERFGYRAGTDYSYFCDCVKEMSDERFEDAHGNIITGRYGEADIAFFGYDSRIVIGDNVSLSSSHIFAQTDSLVEIGGDSVLMDSCIYAYDRARFVSGSSCLFNRLYAQLYDDSAVSFGEHFIVYSFPGKRLLVHSQPDTSVTVGRYCTFSYGVSLMSQDGHSIFDVRTGENINSTKEISASRSIVIGDHVWIGLDVSVLYRTNIGNGSIIGANSVVKGNIPNNCIAVGSPVKVIRRDIAWSQINASLDINMCGADFIALTEDDTAERKK